MNIFNRVIPWFIPTKEDQNKWYKDELLENPKEVNRLVKEFSEISEIYNAKLGEFEARLTKDYELYELYLNVRALAQKTNFVWNRIEYKNKSEGDLKKMLSDLNY